MRLAAAAALERKMKRGCLARDSVAQAHIVLSLPVSLPPCIRKVLRALSLYRKKVNVNRALFVYLFPTHEKEECKKYGDKI